LLRSDPAAQQAPPDVVVKARLLLLDTIGCVLSGRTANPVRRLESLLGRFDPGEFSFPGGPGLSIGSAASLAAMASAWDEGCEGLPYAHGRPALSLIGALIALGVTRRATLNAIIASLIAGYEVGARAGGWLRIKPGMHVDGNWPAMGAAAGTSRLIELDSQQCWNAVALVACQLPTSLYLPIQTGDDARNTYAAHAAALGLQATFASAAGITAPADAVALYARDFAQPDGRPAPSADRWFLRETYFKPHAGVRHAHYGFEAALAIRRHLGFASEPVTRIRLRIYPEATVYAGNRQPQAPITAQFSLSLGVAAGLRFGEMGPSLFRDSRLHDTELRRLEQLVEIEAVDEFGAGGQRAAQLAVWTHGQSFEEFVDQLEGGEQRPLDTGSVIDKFLQYSADTLSKAAAIRFCDAILAGPGHANFADEWRTLTAETL
jgi:2-methylcitrate dehydratase PrpD